MSKGPFESLHIYYKRFFLSMGYETLVSKTKANPFTLKRRKFLSRDNIWCYNIWCHNIWCHNIWNYKRNPLKIEITLLGWFSQKWSPTSLSKGVFLRPNFMVGFFCSEWFLKGFSIVNWRQVHFFGELLLVPIHL